MTEQQPSEAGPSPAELVDRLWAVTLRDTRREILPRDHVAVLLSCGACRAHSSYVFRFAHAPYDGEAGGPAYRDLDEAFALLEELCVRRHPLVPEEREREARRCACGAPPHVVTPIGAALVHAELGRGTHLLLGIYSGARAIVRCPIDGVPSPAEVEAVAPLTLFPAWRELKRSGAPLASIDAEPGVTCWWWTRASGAGFEEAVGATIKGGIVFELAAETVHGAAWPEELRSLSTSLSSGELRLAIAVDRARLRRQLEALTWGHLPDTYVEDAGGEALLLRSSGVDFPIRIGSVLAKMGAYGRTLAEACALAIESAGKLSERAIALLRRAAELRPGVSWELERGLLTPIRPDGRSGRSTPILELAQHLAPAGPDFEREIAFLVDEPPSWADPTSVCPCGARLCVSVRALPWSFLEEFERNHAGHRPRVLRTWGEGALRAAEVVALACDRHVRFLGAGELDAIGLDERRIETRRVADVGYARFAVNAHFVGGAAIVASGPYAASVLLEPRWAASLSRSLGDPIGSQVLGLALGPGACALIDRNAGSALQHNVAALLAQAEMPQFVLDVAIELPDDAPSVIMQSASRGP